MVFDMSLVPLPITIMRAVFSSKVWRLSCFPFWPEAVVWLVSTNVCYRRSSSCWAPTDPLPGESRPPVCKTAGKPLIVAAQNDVSL